MLTVSEWNDRHYWNVQIGYNGKTVRIGDVSLTIPEGALEHEITITIGISQDPSDRPELQANQALVGPVVLCLPHGLSFKRPVTLSIDCDPEVVQESSVITALSRYSFP